MKIIDKTKYIHERYGEEKTSVLPIKPIPASQIIGVYAGAENPRALKLHPLWEKYICANHDKKYIVIPIR